MSKERYRFKPVKSGSEQFYTQSIIGLRYAAVPQGQPVLAPTADQYGAATAASYMLYGTMSHGLTKGQIVDGMTVVNISADVQSHDSFAAVEFQTASCAILVAYEGSVFAGAGGYSSGVATADYDITNGTTLKNIAALTDAQAFALQAANDAAANGSKIYVTGHSLGGTEAEAAAAALVTQDTANGTSLFGGGITFAALASGLERRQAGTGVPACDGLSVCLVKVVAGVGFEPTTFRL